MSRGMPGQGVPVAQPQKPSFGQRFENLFARVGGLDVGGLQVGQDFTEQERNLARNKGLQQFLYALGAGVKGEDPVAAGLQVRRMQEEEELKRQQEEVYQSAFESANPDQQKLMKLLGPSGYSEYQKQIALKQLGLSDSKETAAIANFEYFQSLEPEEQETFKMLEGASPELAGAIAAAQRIGKSAAGLDLSELEKERDKKLAGELVEFERGGFAQVESNLDKLDKVIAQLESSQNLTGPVIGNVPTVLKAFTNPESVGVEDDIRSIVFQSLRETLGAQFTEREGDRLVAASFNPLLSEEINAERLKRLRRETARSAQAKLDMIDYFDENKTLAGYKGEVFDSSNILGNIILPEDYADLSEQDLEQIYLDPNTTDQELRAIEKLIQERQGK